MDQVQAPECDGSGFFSVDVFEYKSLSRHIKCLHLHFRDQKLAFALKCFIYEKPILVNTNEKSCENFSKCVCSRT